MSDTKKIPNQAASIQNPFAPLADKAFDAVIRNSKIQQAAVTRFAEGLTGRVEEELNVCIQEIACGTRSADVDTIHELIILDTDSSKKKFQIHNAENDEFSLPEFKNRGFENSSTGLLKVLRGRGHNPQPEDKNWASAVGEAAFDHIEHQLNRSFRDAKFELHNYGSNAILKLSFKLPESPPDTLDDAFDSPANNS